MWIWILAFMAAGLPAFIVRVGGVHLEPTFAVLVFGLGIVSGAFILSWAAEAARVDVSASLAIAVLALIAILPEYAIEAVLAWDAGQSFVPGSGDITPRDWTGGGQRDRGQQAADRCWLVGRHTHFLAEAAGEAGYAR